MKRIITLLFAIALWLPASAQKDAAYWNKMADGMSQALITNFWGANFEGYPTRYYFNYGSNLSNMTTNHYWPQAHAMDVMVDAYMRTKDKQYKKIYPLWWQGAPEYNFAGKMNPKDAWWNVFVDDMEWIALAQIRMWESTGNTMYINKARQMYDDWIWTTWGPEDEAPWYGGITWKTDVGKSKNACSNGPAALIAARLHRFYDKATGRLMCEVVADEYGCTVSETPIDIFTQSGDDRYDNSDKMIIKGAQVLPHALINNVADKLGYCISASVIGYSGEVAARFVEHDVCKMPLLGHFNSLSLILDHIAVGVYLLPDLCGYSVYLNTSCHYFGLCGAS